MKIGIIGSGVVAQTLGAGLLKHGHEVTLGTRHADKLKDWVEKTPGATVGSFDEAAKFGEVVVLAVGGTVALDWKSGWVIIGESSLLGDPYFLDTSKPDPEGDCPVYTAISGQTRWVPTLAASSFAQFLRILSTAMEIAAGFGDAIMDDEDEDSFREALGPKVKVIDAAALRAGHWT